MPFSYPVVILKAGREKALLRGHPWVFSGAIREVQGDPAPGEVVLITSSTGENLGQGFYHPGCDIALRLISRNAEIDIDEEFWRSRVRDALFLRRRIIPEGTTAFRLVNAEGDGIPGLIVDKYGNFLVVSLETAGIERRREAIIKILAEELRPQGIYERSSGQARAREGLKERGGLIWGEEPPENVLIKEYGIKFLVDVRKGQKTGFFLDQRENRRLFQALSARATVLNCFSYTGGFSIYAVKGGAREVVSVDVSEKAVRMIERHLEMNGLGTKYHRAICADVFDFLRHDKACYDLICLDPPPFARTRKDVEHAFRGYKDINRLALKRLRPNGLLITFSCSGALDEEAFFQAVSQAGWEAGCQVKMLMRLQAGADHPVLLSHTEGRYLKGFVLTVMERYGEA